MVTNKFEDSRVSEGTLQYGAQHDGNVLDESSAVSRDDVRDGVTEPRVTNDITNMMAEGGPAPQPASITETPGPRNFLSTDTVVGIQVHNLAGEELGTIEELVFDPATGSIVYAVLSFGGFLGFGEKRFPVPWKALRIDPRRNEFKFDINKEKLEKAPGFDMKDRPDMADSEYLRQVHSHYSEDHWEHRNADSGDSTGPGITPPDRTSDYDLTSDYRRVQALNNVSDTTGGTSNMAAISTMDELFLDELRDLYDAEKQLTKALPEMADSATSEELRSAFTEHLEQTKGHVQRLEQIFETLGEKGTGKKCAAMAGLIKEGDEIASESSETAVRDAGLIAAAQKVEHYEIAGYGSARAHAELVGKKAAARLLEQTLQEEKEADSKLNEIAQSLINNEAADVSSGSKSGRPKTRTAR